MQDDSNYPLTMLKGRDSRTANSRRDELQFRAEGWAPAYQYQEFPRMLHRDGETLIVNDENQKEQAIAEGWSLTPANPEEAEAETTAEMENPKDETPQPKPGKRGGKRG